MDADRVVAEDLLRLEHELRLLQRAIPLEALALRNRVERDRVRVHHRLGCVSIERSPRLRSQLVDRLGSGARYRLVGRDRDMGQAGGGMERREDAYELDRGAVR